MGHSLGGAAAVSFLNNPYITNFILFDPTLIYADKEYHIQKPVFVIFSEDSLLAFDL